METFVALFFIDKKTDLIAYLLKDKPKMAFLHGKLTGIGGRLEKEETPLEGVLREIKEEIDLDLPKELPQYQGKITDSYGNIVHLFKATFDCSLLPKGHIEDEGHFVYKSKNHHIKNPKEFPKGNPEFLTQLLETNEMIDMDFR